MGENNSNNNNVDVKIQAIQAVQAVQVQGHPQIHVVSADHVHMLAAAAAMSMPGQIDDGQVGVGSVEPTPIQVVDAQPIHVHYMQASDAGMEEDGDDGGGSEGMEGDMPPDQQQVGVVTRSQVANQLTLSFQGEVYVFDSVPPEKVVFFSFIFHLFPFFDSVEFGYLNVKVEMLNCFYVRHVM